MHHSQIKVRTSWHETVAAQEVLDRICQRQIDPLSHTKTYATGSRDEWKAYDQLDPDVIALQTASAVAFEMAGKYVHDWPRVDDVIRDAISADRERRAAQDAEQLVCFADEFGAEAAPAKFVEIMGREPVESRA